MKKFALIAVAALVAATGAVSPTSAALSDHDSPVWRGADNIQVAARGGERGARQDGGRGRDARRQKKGDDIWRIRDGKRRPFFLFRRDRGPDCSVRKMRVQDASGAMVTRSVHICE